jgi:cellulose synthase (UDP-forming)
VVGPFVHGRLFNVVLLAAAAVALLYIFHHVERYQRPAGQIAIGWGLLALVILLYAIKPLRRPPWRLLFMVAACLVSARYFIWRTFETLLYTGPADFAAMSMLYVAEVYALTVHFLGMFINVWPIERGPAGLPDDTSLLPTVDVFIPTYNEPAELVRVTAVAASQIDYPSDRLRIHIIDDGGTAARRREEKTSWAAWERHFSLKFMASKLGVDYMTRDDNAGAKAGNINNALKRTGGELVLILDCDHVPTRDILKRTVGYFLRDEKLFLVQTPHFFINPTPVEKGLTHFSNVPSENEMFYRVIHLGLDTWNSSFFCGSAALLRRTCLEESGGIAGETITEDAETSLVLHGRGYNSLYLNRPMVCGLSPETYDDYILQRTRWAQGMLQIFVLKNPLFMRGLTLAQRLCYFNSCFFWFFGISRVTFYLAPTAFLILGLKVYHASAAQILAYALPHVFATFAVMGLLYGKVRKPIYSEIYQSVQSIYLIPAVLSTLFKPRRPTFKVTPKDRKLDRDFLNPMASSFFLLAVVNMASVPLAVLKWFYQPLYREVIVITLVWCVFNIFLAIVSLGAFWERKQVRHHHRLKTKGKARITFPRLGQTVEGEIKDISLTGIGVEVRLPLEGGAGEEAVVKVEDSYGEAYEFKARINVRVTGKDTAFCGAEFSTEGDAYARLVRYVYGDSARWVEIWEEGQRGAGVVKEVLYFFRMGLKASRESIVYLNGSASAALSGCARRLRLLAHPDNNPARTAETR